jgi:PAS domain S-box-containing protein
MIEARPVILNKMERMSEVSSFLQDRFFDLSIDMLCIAHFSGYFLKLNAAWERTLGFTVEEVTVQGMFEFVHRDDRERTLEQNRIVRSGGEALGFDNRYVRKDGSYRRVHVQLHRGAQEGLKKCVVEFLGDASALFQAYVFSSDSLFFLFPRLDFRRAHVG